MAAAVTAVIAGCGTGHAGAAAIVGEERISNADIQSDVADVQDLYAESGRHIPRDQLPMVASQVLSIRIGMALTEEIAEDNGISLGEEAIDSKVDQLGGHEAMVAQGMADLEIERMAKDALVGEGLMDQTPQSELSSLRERVRESVREQLTQEADTLGLTGEDREERIETSMEEQEGLIEAELPAILLNERFSARIDDTEIEVSPRYGVLDPVTSQIIPGQSRLSAPEAPQSQPLAPPQPGTGG